MGKTIYAQRLPFYEKLKSYIKARPDTIFKPFNATKPGTSLSPEGIITIWIDPKDTINEEEFMRLNGITENDLL